MGITEMSMIPTKSMRSRVAYMHHREHDGSLRHRDHLLRVPLVVDLENRAQIDQIFNSGGAGMFARPQEYCSETIPRPHFVCASIKHN